jgi:hypothetical protein
VRWSVVALSLVLSLAGCGVPDSGPPVVYGPADDVLDIGKYDVEPLPQPDATDAKRAVQRYFEAASSEWDNLPRQVRPFLTSDTAVPTSSTILVVRDLRFGDTQVPNPGNGKLRRVRVTGRVTGELTRTGAMKSASGAFSHVFDVVQEKLKETLQQTREIWRIKNPPPQYVLSEQAVAEWYAMVSLYFSNRRSTTTLIPELRYVPNVVWADEPRNLLVDWLLAGPSSWFSPVAVTGFPNGARRLGNVVLDENQVVVDLRGVNEQLTELQFAQLVWTLRPLTAARQLQVRIEGRPVSYDSRQAHSLDDVERLNAVSKDLDGAIGYYVRDGEVFRLAQEGAPETPAGSDQDDGNEDGNDPPVVSAAMSRAADLAALVRKRDNDWSLWVGRRSGLSRTIRYHEVSGLPPGPIGVPEWAAGIGGAPGSFLVTVAGAVYQVEPGKRAVPVAARSTGAVDKLSVAPDGFRVAVISRGRLYLGGLLQDGDNVRLQKLRPVTDQFRHAADIAWSGEHELVVVDRGLWQVKVDGLRAGGLPSQDKAPEQVAAYPTVEGKGRILVTVDGRLYEVHSTEMSAPAKYDSSPVGNSPFFGF